MVDHSGIISKRQRICCRHRTGLDAMPASGGMLLVHIHNQRHRRILRYAKDTWWDISAVDRVFSIDFTIDTKTAVFAGLKEPREADVPGKAEEAFLARWGERGCPGTRASRHLENSAKRWEARLFQVFRQRVCPSFELGRSSGGKKARFLHSISLEEAFCLSRSCVAQEHYG